jgi:hypothetical protein
MNRHLGERYLCVLINMHELAADGLDGLLFDLARNISRGLVRKHGIAVGSPDRTDFDRDGRSGLARFMSQVWQAVGERHLLLMIDEMARLHEEVEKGRLDRSIFGYLRHLMADHEQLSFLFSIGTGIERLEREYAQLFSAAVYHPISFLEDAAARDLITKPAQGFYEFSLDAVRRVLLITSGHPYYTQLICHCLFARWQQSGRRTVTVDDVDAVMDYAAELGSANLAAVWAECSPAERAVLAGLAAVIDGPGRGARPAQVEAAWSRLGVVIPSEELAHATKDLVSRDVLSVSRDVPSGDATYQLNVDLLRRWLRRHWQLEWVKDDISTTVDEWYRHEVTRRRRGRMHKTIIAMLGAVAASGLAVLILKLPNMPSSSVSRPCSYMSYCPVVKGSFLEGAFAERIWPGYTDPNGYVAGLNNVPAAVIVKVGNVPAAREYTLTIRYANSIANDGKTEPRSLSILVDGNAQSVAAGPAATLPGEAARFGKAAFPVTPSWSDWELTTARVALKKGIDYIALACLSGDTCHVNVDWIQIR